MRFRLLLGFLLLAADAAAECNPALRIGMSTGLSGPGKSWGDSNKNGFEMGLAESGCTGVFRIYEDDQFDARKSVTAFRKLVEQDHVNVVIGTSSSTGNAVAPLAEKLKIPYLVWASDPNVSKDRQFVLRTWNSGQDEGKFLIRRAFARGYRKIALVSHAHEYSRSVEDGMVAQVAEPDSKMEIVSEDTFPMDSADYRSFLTKLRGKPIDGLYNCLMVSGAAGLFAKQARQIGITVPIFGCEGMELQGNFEQSEGALAGAWFSSENVEDGFEQRYRAKYGEPGTLPGVAIMYDVVKILMGTKSSGGEGLIREIFEAGPRQGVLGEIKPVKTESDQYFSIPFIERSYAKDGAVVTEKGETAKE